MEQQWGRIVKVCMRFPRTCRLCLYCKYIGRSYLGIGGTLKKKRTFESLLLDHCEEPAFASSFKRALSRKGLFEGTTMEDNMTNKFIGLVVRRGLDLVAGGFGFDALMTAGPWRDWAVAGGILAVSAVWSWLEKKGKVPF